VPEIIGYRELRPEAALAGHVECLWLGTASRPATRLPGRLLPDGRVDLIWREDAGLIVAGPDTAWRKAPQGPFRVGVRFLPGAAAPVLGVAMSELRDTRVPLAALWGADAARLETVLAGASAERQVVALQEAVAQRIRDGRPVDRLVACAVARLRHARPPAAWAIAVEVGLSERQLRRRFRHAVGYGPRTLARILRLERLVGLAARRGAAVSLGELALQAGYADHAHMCVDVRRLAGASPGALFGTRWGPT
jgi:AraC-like DNA-binding protein